MLSVPLLRGACSRSCTYNISEWLVLYQNLQFFPVSHFFDCQKTIVAMIDSKHGFCLWGTADCATLSSRRLRGRDRVPSAVLPAFPSQPLRVLCCCSSAPWKSSVKIDQLALGRAKPGLLVLPLPRHARPRRQRAETRFWKIIRPGFALPRASGSISTLLFRGAGEQHQSTRRRRARRSREVVAVESNLIFLLMALKFNQFVH